MYNWVTLLYSRKTVNQLYSNKSEKKTKQKEAPAPFKTKTKAMALKARKQFWKAPMDTQTDLDLTHFKTAQNTVAQEAAQISSEEHP